MLQLITGGGKTEIFVDTQKKFLAKGRRVLTIAHREELINQAWNKLHQHGIVSGIIKGGVEPNLRALSQVASIQTITRRRNIPAPDLIVIDEAHHTQEDNTYGKVIFDMFPNAYVLGVTATPYRLNGMGFTSLFQDLILGPTMEELVAAGYLTPLRYFVAKKLPDLSTVGKEKGDYKAEEAANAIGTAPLLESYTEHCLGMRGVGFAVNIKHSRNIVDMYNAAGITAAHIDGEMHMSDRKAILDRFKAGEIMYISNVGIITEGFDFPDMEFVQLARPTLSLALFLQMIGRVTRTDYNVIKHATDDQVRAALVAGSKKPYGYVLDNAGCHLTHGMPWHEFNWRKHFEGYAKKDNKPKDMIEIITYVAEDESGRRVSTELPEEIQGLRLVEITKVSKERPTRKVDLNEFDATLEKFKNIKGMKKKGFAALNNFLMANSRNNAIMSAEHWEHLIKKLSTEVNEQVQKINLELSVNLKATEDMYAHNPIARDSAIAVIKAAADKKIEVAKLSHVPSGYIKKLWAEYNKEHNIEYGTTSELQTGLAQNLGF